jgi:16S rRNA (uracil1498-N3)-methyltransferase
MIRRFYAPPQNFNAVKIKLDVDETKHLRDVLRLSAGAQISVFDGAGKEVLCEIERIERGETFLKILDETTPSAPESNLNLTLAVALLKGEKFDLVVQKAVELGASKIVPLITKRADAKIRDAPDAAKKLERWRRIALEAAKQSGRAKLPEIVAPTNFNDFVKNSTHLVGKNLILFAENGGESFEAVTREANEILEIVAVIGAEGGWEMSEIEAARANNFQILTFAGRILRAETAAIAVAAVLQHRFGDFK